MWISVTVPLAGWAGWLGGAKLREAAGNTGRAVRLVVGLAWVRAVMAGLSI